MILAILRTGFRALRRDRAALVLSFIVPIAFFTIFGIIFGRQHMDLTPRVSVIVVDEDRSIASQRLVRGLIHETSLNAFTRPAPKQGEPAPPEYTAASADHPQGVRGTSHCMDARQREGRRADPALARQLGSGCGAARFRHAAEDRDDLDVGRHGRRGHEVL